MATTREYRFEQYDRKVPSNRYGGTCVCGDYVFAGDGFYDGGQVFCTRPGRVTFGCEQVCERLGAAQVRQMVAADLAPRVKHVPTPEEVAAAKERAEQDRRWEQQGLRRCVRCGGAGGRHEWPGYTCFGCDGHGTTEVG